MWSLVSCTVCEPTSINYHVKGTLCPEDIMINTAVNLVTPLRHWDVRYTSIHLKLKVLLSSSRDNFSHCQTRDKLLSITPSQVFLYGTNYGLEDDKGWSVSKPGAGALWTLWSWLTCRLAARWHVKSCDPDPVWIGPDPAPNSPLWQLEVDACPPPLLCSRMWMHTVRAQMLT